VRLPRPQVYERTETDLVMDYLDGPTMLADLTRRPWRLLRHAKTLAQLHRQLHAIPAPADLPGPLGEGTSLVHLDLHPGNVLLTASGLMVIDWPNAGRGSGLADVACTWVILTASRLEGSIADRLIAAVAHRRADSSWSHLHWGHLGGLAVRPSRVADHAGVRLFGVPEVCQKLRYAPPPAASLLNLCLDSVQGGLVRCTRAWWNDCECQLAKR
jgi:aminoglycoside phosphotransferase (APT) family kinase protein